MCVGVCVGGGYTADHIPSTTLIVLTVYVSYNYTLLYLPADSLILFAVYVLYNFLNGQLGIFLGLTLEKYFLLVYFQFA